MEGQGGQGGLSVKSYGASQLVIGGFFCDFNSSQLKDGNV